MTTNPSPTATLATSRRNRSRARPWLVVIGILLIAANLRAAITGVGPILTLIREDQSLSAVAASVLISVPLVAFALMSPLAPLLAHRLGLERILTGALVALAVGILLRSSPPQPLLWVGTAVIGVAIALLNVLLPSLLKRDFPTRLGPLTGAYSAVQSSAAALAAGLAVPLAGGSESGWRFALGVWAGLALIALGVFSPQLRWSAGPRHPAAASDMGHRVRAPWTRALAWQITLFMGLQSLSYYSMLAWLATILQDAGLDAGTAGFYMFLLNLSGILGSLTCSALLHRLRDQRPLTFTASLITVSALTGFLIAPEMGIIWACIAGFASSSTLVLSLALFGLRTRNHQEAAALSGMAQSIGYSLAALGPIAIGALYDATASWTLPLSVLIALAGTQAVLGLLAGRPRVLR